MIAVIGRPVELVMAVSLVNGVLGLIPRGVDKSERLAHEPVPSYLLSSKRVEGRQPSIRRRAIGLYCDQQGPRRDRKPECSFIKEGNNSKILRP